ncbi:MAG: HD domain-containing phosphohydrolase [Desulfobacula sp.]|jgi:response regulator RpfG family c-di-GMP phosphodiesterase
MTIPNDKKKNTSELISLLYVYESGEQKDFKEFSKGEGFAFEICRDLRSAAAVLKLKQPDLVIIESDNDIHLENLIRELSEVEFKFKPAVFLSFTEYPALEERLRFLRDGVDDFLIRPVSPEEVKKKVYIFLDVKKNTQANNRLNQTLEKTTDYLNRFKQELKKTKSELYEERLNLNNALKQINQMANERTRLKRDIKNIKKTLGSNMEGFSEILIGLIKTGIERNRGHAERVADIAGFMAKQLKLDEEKLSDLRKAAALHETGLLLIPDEILQKGKEERTNFEAALFIQHPVKGAALLSSCTEFQNCAGIIRYMNENADGTGKPDGLKKKSIPLLSRILAGADVFDTLREEKEMTSPEILLTRLGDYSGTRLDPIIVALLEKYAVLYSGSDEFRTKGKGIHQLEPGMKLGTALFTNTGTKLFSANTLLTQEAIDKIKQYSREYPVDETVYIRV